MAFTHALNHENATLNNLAGAHGTAQSADHRVEFLHNLAEATIDLIRYPYLEKQLVIRGNLTRLQ